MTSTVVQTRVGVARRPRVSFGVAWPLAPALTILAVIFVGPVIGLLIRSVLEPQFGLGNYVEVFGSTTYLRVFANTFLVATVVTIVTLLLAFPVAWFLAVAPRFWAGLLFAVVILCQAERHVRIRAK